MPLKGAHITSGDTTRGGPQAAVWARAPDRPGHRSPSRIPPCASRQPPPPSEAGAGRAAERPACSHAATRQSSTGLPRRTSPRRAPREPPETLRWLGALEQGALANLALATSSCPRRAGVHRASAFQRLPPAARASELRDKPHGGCLVQPRSLGCTLLTGCWPGPAWPRSLPPRALSGAEGFGRTEGRPPLASAPKKP